MNESIHHIERLDLPNPIVCVQQDAGLRETCRPKKALWLLSKQAWKAGKGETYGRAVRYDPRECGGSSRSLTANVAIRYLSRAGVKKITMLAFDACLDPDRLDYAEAVGYAPDAKGKSPERFRSACEDMRRAAEYDRVTLVFAEAVRRWTIACVFRTGGRYGPEHVIWWAAQVRRRVKSPHRIVCLTDSAEAIPGVETVRLERDWPGWWSKIEIFRPGLSRGPVLYLDLDVVLTADIRLPLPDRVSFTALYAPEDWWRRGERNSSVMLFGPGACRDAYDRFLADPAGNMERFADHGDQAYISDALRGRLKPPPLRITSYKASQAAENGPGDAQIVVFHGVPKPWDVRHDWIPPLRPIVREIDIRVTWASDKNIGAFYNRVMKQHKRGDWVLFLDHDAMVLTPGWYRTCLRAVNEHPEAGLFTCRTNRGRRRVQHEGDAPRSDDISEHYDLAVRLARRGAAVKPCGGRGWGFFLLIAYDAWKKMGGFKDGFYGVDTDAFDKVRAAGYHTYLLDGVYAYHAMLTSTDASLMSALNPSPGCKYLTPATAPRQDHPRTAPVAIVVTAHGEPRYLGWAVEAMTSVDGQICAPRERILVLDSAPEASPASDYAESRGWGVIRGNWRNPGPARNAGIAATSSPWLVCLDADNLLPDRFFDGCRRAIADAGQRDGILYFDYIEFGDREGLRRFPEFDPALLALQNFVDASALVRREVYAELRGWRAEPHPVEDWNLALRAHAAGWRLRRVPYLALRYRVHTRSALRGGRAMSP